MKIFFNFQILITRKQHKVRKKYGFLQAVKHFVHHHVMDVLDELYQKQNTLGKMNQNIINTVNISDFFVFYFNL